MKAQCIRYQEILVKKNLAENIMRAGPGSRPIIIIIIANNTQQYASFWLLIILHAKSYLYGLILTSVHPFMSMIN